MKCSGKAWAGFIIISIEKMWRVLVQKAINFWIP